MPYQARFNYDDEDKQNGTNISGSTGAAAVGIPGQESSKPQKGSGQYANIQSYLEANKDQGDQMGQRVAGDVSSKADDAQSKISSYESKAPSVRAYDPNEAYNNLGNLSTEQKNEYKANKVTGGYSGPQTSDKVQGYDDAQKAYNEANQKIENTKTETGQQQLLRGSYERPSYSAGENKLDQVLLQNSPSSRSRLEELGQKYSGLNSMFNTANTNVGNAVNSAVNQSAQNKAAIVAGEKGQWDSLLNPLQQRADQLNQENPAILGRVSSDISDDTLSEETLAKLGLNAGQNLWDTNLASYLTPNQTQLGVNDVANASERTKYQQLADLFEDPSRTQIGNAGLSTDPFSFEKTKLESDLSAKEAEYNKGYNENKGVFNMSYVPENLRSQVVNLQTATPKELAEKWIPLIQSQYSDDKHMAVVNAMKKSVEDFNNKYKNTRKVIKG